MIFIEFIKSKPSEDSPVGDLVNDILRDKNFPVNKKTKKIIDYLNFQTSICGTNKIFKQLLKQYKKHLLDNPANDKFEDIVEGKFSVLNSEKWNFYKENFSVGKVYLVGKEKDIYKVYCVNDKSGKALYFDIKSNSDLNDIRLIDEKKNYIGNLTRKSSVKEAIQILENCIYDTPIKPNEKKISELLDFLKRING